MERDKRKKRNPVGSGKFTDAGDLKNRFFANSEERRKKIKLLVILVTKVMQFD